MDPTEVQGKDNRAGRWIPYPAFITGMKKEPGIIQWPGGMTVSHEEDLYEAYRGIKKKLHARRGKESYRFAYELLECAKKDFIASLMLFRAHVYPLAIFHLQQAAEKADKSLSAYEGYLDEQDMRRAGHNRVKADKLMEPKVRTVLEEWDVIHPGFSKLHKSGWSMADLRPSPFDLMRAPRSQIMPLVFGVDMGNLRKWYRERKNFERAIKKRGVKIKSTVHPMRERILKLQLTKIAILMTPHAWTTRYATMDANMLSPSDYTPELGIVQTSNELVITVGQAIAVIDQIYREEKKTPYSSYGKFRVTTHPGRKSKDSIAYRFEYSLLGADSYEFRPDAPTLGTTSLIRRKEGV